MITKNKILSGINEHLVSFVINPNMECGTVCQIGDSWFCFGGLTADEMNPEEYLANVPIEDIVQEVLDVLNDFQTDAELKDEYDYYDAILTYKNGYSN